LCLWQYVDILGTCFNDKRRPVTLSAQNLEAYKKRIENGLFFLSPENLDEVNGLINYNNRLILKNFIKIFFFFIQWIIKH